ncbi:MAG: ABC transporter permease [Eubacterium sp.]
MFWHDFKYSFKTLFRNRILIFWTFAFPILLGIFFNMAFSDIEKSEKLDVIDIAIVDNDDFESNEILKAAFLALSDSKNEDRLFNITYTDLEKSKELLDNNEITGYLIFNGDDIDITVSSSGINETILRYAADEIISNKEIYATVSQSAGAKTAKLNNISNKNLSYTMIEYYTLIAMACLYGGVLSMFITNYKLANMNSVGKRTSVSPIRKGKMLIGSLLASYLVQLLGIVLLFLFTIFILKVDYGNNLPFIILLACCGSLAGLSMGVAVAVLIKTNENAKTGILIAVTMAGCFLSGMMGITMKYVIDKNVPVLNKINPAAMITDGLYSLYYYDTLDRFIFNIISLLIFSLLMIFISYRGLRRQKYDSI